MTDPIRFNDGAAYERYMGHWSQLTGHVFLDWLAPAGGLRWLDVGCGNGAFTQLVVDRCAPAAVHGIDPSEAQLAYAQRRPWALHVALTLGDAMALPFAADAFDVAVMPLVIFFVPDPRKGVEEMVRVVRPGGCVAAYGWDMQGGFPYDALQVEMRVMGIGVSAPPSPQASEVNTLHALWADAGLEAIAVREIVVQRSFADFDDYWATVQGGPSVAAKLAALSAADTAELQARMRQRLPATPDGRITYSARANAIKGYVP